MARLEKDGVVGVISGRAIYSGTLRLPEAVAWLREQAGSDARWTLNSILTY